MKAEVLAVGSELLTPLRSDTNALWLTEQLLGLGIEVHARTTVADSSELLASAFRSALARSELVIATGGLGPTEDDLTRLALATATGRSLRRDAAQVEALRARFARLGRVMAENNAQQADLIDGARLLPNARGSAPGQELEHAGGWVYLLPGPPKEMQPMFLEQVRPALAARTGGRVLKTRVLRLAAVSESDVDQAAAPLYTTYTNPRTTILSAPGQVELHLTASGADPAAAELRLEELAEGLRQRLPGRIYSEDGRELHEVVAALLAERGLTLTLAESCTGGLVAARLTSVAGASRFLDRGFVTYSNAAKQELLGVEPTTIEAHGAVSAEVAIAMAHGARRAARTDIGAAVTGIAGPDGGSDDKPIGLTFFAIVGPGIERVRRVQLYAGVRENVRHQAGQTLLELLRRALLGLPD